jgi:predicted RNase H-like HicB family nuclease
MGVARDTARTAGWIYRRNRCPVMSRWWTATPAPTASSCPICPAARRGGATIDEALINAQNAASLWADEMLAQGGGIPVPRTIGAAVADPEIAAAIGDGAALALVPLVRDSGRPTRANISLDRGLLDAIDQAAAARGLTRSAFLATAAREKIANEG